MDLPETITVAGHGPGSTVVMVQVRGRTVAPGLAIVEASDPDTVEHTVVPGRYALVHTRSGRALASILTCLCARHIEECAAAAVAWGYWDFPAEELQADKVAVELVTGLVRHVVHNARCWSTVDVDGVEPARVLVAGQSLEG